jgi:P-type E1-E2 ATPase
LTALAVLVVATPCPLILATPIAVIGAVDRAAGFGLVVKSGSAMEEMGRARAVLFDKTGTLTSGHPEVEQVVVWGDVEPRELLRRAGALEQLSSHPLAEAVVRRARSDGGSFPDVEDSHEFAGSGLSGIVAGHRMLIGSRTLAASESRRSLDVEWAALAARTPLAGRLVSFILIDGTPVGAILFSERLRPEVPGLTRRLRGLGVEHIALLTGDNRANAEEIGRQAEIPAIVSDLLPEAKVEQVRDARRRFGSTIMVGDGINDAAALATASVGIAMGAQGAGVSAEAADAVLLVDDVSRVADGIALGQRMLLVARQGIVFGLGASLVLMAVASFGAIAPALGAVLQEVIDVAVILNALRAR